MPQITWKNLGDLDFSDSNDLRVKGSEMMANGAKTLVDMFKEIAAKNAVIEKEQRDAKFASAIQEMSLAQNEGQLRQSYIDAMKVDGIGADNVLRLTDTYKGYQKGILDLQSKRLSNIGQGLVNTGKQQTINYTAKTQPLKIQSDNAVNKGVLDTIQGKVASTNSNNALIVKQNAYKSSQIDSNTKAQLPFLEAQNKASEAITGIAKSDYDAQIIQAKKDVGIPLSDAKTKLIANNTNQSKNKLIQASNIASIKSNLPELVAKESAAKAELGITKSNQDKKILDNTEAATMGTAINEARTALVKSAVASENSFNNANLEQEANTAKLKSETAKYDALDDNYYSDKKKAELLKIKDAEDLRRARIQAEKDKSAISRAKVKEIDDKIKRRQAISNVVNETMIISQNDKTLSPTKMYERALKSLRSKGKKLTAEEALGMFDHFVKVSKFEDRKISPLKGTASKFATQDDSVNKHYNNLNNKDKELIDTVMTSLQSSGAILDGGVIRKIKPSRHEEYMKGLIEHMSKNTDNWSPFTFDTTNAVEGYTKYNRNWFNKTVNETRNPLKIKR